MDNKKYFEEIINNLKPLVKDFEILDYKQFRVFEFCYDKDRYALVLSKAGNICIYKINTNGEYVSEVNLDFKPFIYSSEPIKDYKAYLSEMQAKTCHWH